MQTLFLDLASQKASVALCNGAQVIAKEIDPRMGDDRLLPTIEALLKEAKIEYKDLSRIACTVGPGGFTSLRMAVTVANTLSHELSIPLAGIHLSDLYRARSKDTPLLWVHSTKSTMLFARTFLEGSLWPSPTLVTVEEFQKHLSTLSDHHFCGELIEAHRNVVTSIKESALAPLSAMLPLYLDTLNYEQNPVEAWYGRGY